MRHARRTFERRSVNGKTTKRERGLVRCFRVERRGNELIDDYDEMIRLSKDFVEEISGSLKRRNPIYSRRDLYEKAVEEIGCSFENMAMAIRFEDPAIFARHVSWLAKLTGSYGTNAGDALHSMRKMCELSKSKLPERTAKKVCDYAELAMKNPIEDKELRYDANLQKYYEKYLKNLLVFDKTASFRTVNQAVNDGFDVKKVYIDVFERALHKIGFLWQTGRITVAHEHYATASTQYIMSKFYGKFLEYSPLAPKAVFLCVPDEMHELGSRMTADLFDFNGWETVYFGANTPISSVIRYMADYDCDLVGISVTMNSNLPAAEKLIEKTRNLNGKIKIMAGGRAIASRKISDLLGADGTARNAVEALEVAGAIVKGGEPI